MKTLGVSGVVLAGGVTAISGQSDDASDDVGELELVYEFEPPEGSPQEPPFGQHPENVAIDPFGNKFVSVPSQAQIWKFGPEDELVDQPFVQFDSTEEFLVGPTGVEYDPSGRLYSAFVSDLSSSEDAETNGVYEIDDENGEYELYAEISNDVEDFPTFPNDIALLENSLLVTDSFSGVIWEVKRGRAEVWAGELWDGEDDFPTGPLAPPAPAAAGPQFGPNGLQFTEDKRTLYVANTAKGTIVEIPVFEGNAREPEVFVEGLVAPDGLAMDVDENLYVADNGANQILRISPNGDVEVLAENEAMDGEQETTTEAETTTAEEGTTTAEDGTTTDEAGTTTPEEETTTAEAGTTTPEDGTATAEEGTTTPGDGTTTDEEGTTTPGDGTATTEQGDDQTEPDSEGGVPVLDQPADVTFGTTDDQLETLYIVNLALTSQFEEPRPSFVKLDVGVDGLPVER
ncbi:MULTISPECIES: SMP-30/gluconolactonase/LRE family protein [Haloferax]|uniref:SMP-30/gluconolactonase/LRE family protein n=1 Tax=Haloferax TaxID=2251 RepID=UPI00177ED523|nr:MULTISPECIES: SMP-30/gluconolactonase/LRE family protein [Haloferax]